MLCVCSHNVDRVPQNMYDAKRERSMEEKNSKILGQDEFK